MAKKRKVTALQRKTRRQAEKLARALYAAGRTPAAEPKSTAARQKKREAVRKEQKAHYEWINMRPDDVSQMSKRNTKKLLSDLLAIAHAQYSMLIDQGTPNSATAIFENEFAFLNPNDMTINAMRAKIIALQKWLRRKDVIAKRAKRKQQKDLKWLREHGFPDVTEDELTDFYDMYARYLEYAGYGKHYITGRLANFANIYAQLDDPSMPDALERIDKEMRAQYERDTGDTFGGMQLSGGDDVQSPDAGPVAPSGPEQPRAARPGRGSGARRKQRKAAQAARKAAKLAARKKRWKRQKGR